MDINEKRELAHTNRTKYLKPPTIKQLSSFIKQLGVTDTQFERFFGIPYNMITQVRSGAKNLPAAYWHIVYEKVVPTYGDGFKNNTQVKPLIKEKELTVGLTQQSAEKDHQEVSSPPDDPIVSRLII